MRVTERRNRDGSTVAYYALAENLWNATSKRSEARVVHSFGRADQLDRAALQRLVASIQRVIDDNPSDVSTYNLSQPRLEVTFKAGGKDHKLLIGRKTPPGSDLYAKIDDQPRVVLIPSFVESTFNRSTFDLRDKAVLTVNRDEIGSLSVTTPSSTLRLEKVAGEWKLPTGGNGLHARQRLAPFDQLLEKRRSLRTRVPGGRQCQLHRQDVIRPEAGIDALQPQEALNH